MAKKKQVKEAPVKDIFAHFEEQGRIEAVGKREPPVDNTALLKQIEEQGKQIKELTENRSRDFPMLAPNSSNGQPVVTVDPAKLKVDLAGLPNRDEDPEGYAREYNTRVNAALEAKAEAVRRDLTSQFEQQRAADRLWNGFKQAYPQWAKFESLVETVTNRTAQDLQAKGVDLQRLMTGNPALFYKEIEHSLAQQYGKLIEDGGSNATGGDEDEDDDAPGLESDPMQYDPARADFSTDGKPASKTGPTVSQGKNEPDMFDDLRAIQRRMKII